MAAGAAGGCFRRWFGHLQQQDAAFFYACQHAQSSGRHQLVSECDGLVNTSRDGGTLVYSTCSAAKKQNEDIVQWLLDREAQAQLMPLPLPAVQKQGSSKTLLRCAAVLFTAFRFSIRQ